VSRKRQETINCDAPGCQEIKGDSNHWFSVYYDKTEEVVKIGALNDEYSGDDLRDFCGEACLIKGLPTFIRRLSGVQ